MTDKPKRHVIREDLQGMTVNYFIRPLAQEIVLALWNTKATAQHIMIARLLINLVSLGCFLMGSFGVLVIGFLLFEFHIILGHVYELYAKLKRQDSTVGKCVDVLFDTILSSSFALLGLALAIGYYHATHSMLCVYLLIPAYVGHHLTIAYKHAFREVLSSSAFKMAEGSKWSKSLKECYRWKNQIVLWGALLYYPCQYYFSLNTYVLGFIIIMLMANVKWLSLVVRVFRQMKEVVV